MKIRKDKTINNKYPHDLVNDVFNMIDEFPTYRSAETGLGKTAGFLCRVRNGFWEISEDLAALAGWKKVVTWVRTK